MGGFCKGLRLAPLRANDCRPTLETHLNISNLCIYPGGVGKVRMERRHIQACTEMDNRLQFGAGSNLTPRALRLQLQL